MESFQTHQLILYGFRSDGAWDRSSKADRLAGTGKEESLQDQRRYGRKTSASDAQALTPQSWQNETRRPWMARSIRNITEWMERDHGEVNFNHAQFLSGQAYLASMGKVEDARCQYYDSAWTTTPTILSSSAKDGETIYRPALQKKKNFSNNRKHTYEAYT